MKRGTARSVAGTPATDALIPEKQPVKGDYSGAVDALLAELGGKEETPSTFALMVGSVVLHFRRPDNMSQVRSFKEHGMQWIVKHSDPDFQASIPNQDMRAALSGRTTDDLVAAYTVRFWSAEPTRISPLQAVLLTRKAGVMDKIVRAINQEFDFGLNAVLLRNVETQKKGSARTGLGASGSRSRKKSTASTGTN